MRIEHILGETAERFGHKAAIVAGRSSHSYAELNVKSDRLAAAMIARGVKRGDRVAIFLDNGFPAVATMFAVLKAGAVASPIDPSADAERLVRLLDHSRAVGLVTEARLASVAATAMRQALGVRLVVLAGGDRSPSSGSCMSFEDVVSRIGAVEIPAFAGGDSPAFVLPGTDGEAEAETLTHADLIAVASVAKTPEDAVVVASLPISSHHGLYQLLTAIKAGATQVLRSPFDGRSMPVGPGAEFQNEMKLALAG